MKKIKNIKNYWPLVKEMSQITLLLVIFLAAMYKAFTAQDVDMQKIWGGVTIAAGLFSLVPMYVATFKSYLPKGK